MGRATAAVVSGIVVGALTGAAAWSFFLAATWSGIHGGMSQIVLALVALVAAVVPPVCGSLTGWAIYRWRPRRRASRMIDPIRLNCPHCGCSLKPSDYSAAPPYAVVECPIHGPLHFGPDTDLTLGRPPVRLA